MFDFKVGDRVRVKQWDGPNPPVDWDGGIAKTPFIEKEGVIVNLTGPLDLPIVVQLDEAIPDEEQIYSPYELDLLERELEEDLYI